MNQIKSPVHAILSQRIRALREKRGLSLHELAHAAGMSVSGLAYIEYGQKDARLSTLARIAGGLRVEVREFFH